MSFRHRAGFLAAPAPVYFDQLIPERSGSLPNVVMVHGGSHTGSCYMLTADGRPGWAYRFAAAGYQVTVPDWPGHGRSGGALLEGLDGHVVAGALAALVRALPTPVVLLAHSMGAAFAWRVAELCRERITHVLAVAPAAPGNCAPVGALVSEDERGVVVATGTRLVSVPSERYSRASRAMLDAKLVGAGTQFPASAVAAYAQLVSPTAARLVYERANVGGSQLRVGEPQRLAGLDITVVTGSADLDHPREVDAGLVDWWRAQGAKARLMWLADHGIEGNGHMMMLEANSDEVADLLIGVLVDGASR